jgi:phospholipase C
MGLQPTRRDVLKAGALGAAAAAGDLPRFLQDALAQSPSCGSLGDIEHVVILIQENRSFDHYFGRYRGVRGFADPNAIKQSDNTSIFAQKDGKGGSLLPYRMDTAVVNPPAKRPGECIDDISHQWLMQHQCFDGGKLDAFLSAHLVDEPSNGVQTMGYYERADIAFYYALADAFTICDNYFCSVIGGTDINRLYTLSATMDPDGFDGGAQFLDTRVSDRPSWKGKLGKGGKWVTYPEQLSARGISWKVYSTADSQVDNNVLFYFNAYQSDPALAVRAFGSQQPGPYLADFLSDCLAGTLPQVSWVLAGNVDSEHPPAPLEWGQDFTRFLLQSMTLNSEVWKKSVLFVTYDENGGFFDHVVPPFPTAAGDLPGEVVPKVSKSSPAYKESGNGTVLGPIGLGFRVPTLVVSPFSRGGLVCSEVFDHTSMLRFVERRFGAEIPRYDPANQRPGLTAWRERVTGDMTGAFNFAAAPDTSVPSLPTTNRADPRVLAECTITGAPGNLVVSAFGTPYPPPENQVMPGQEAGAARRPSGAVECRAATGTTSPGPGQEPPSLPFSRGPDRAFDILASGFPELAAGAALIGGALWLRRRRSRPTGPEPPPS